MNSLVMDANPSMWGRHADILPQGLQESPMGVHAIECNGEKTAFQWKILDQCSNQSKLLTLEALYIRTMKPAINTRDEHRTQELTLKA